MQMADRYFIDECLNGDSSAFGMLVDKYKECVYALAYSRLHNFHDAEDITQEAFIKAYQNLRKLRRWDNFHSWIYAITNNLCKMWLRSKSTRPDREFIEDHALLSKHQEPLQNSIMEQLYEALDSLPENYQQVLTLYYLGGMNSKEIAEFLGMSSSAVWQRLSRARLSLKKEMLDMMSETYDQNILKAGFTFQILEIVKWIGIQPVSPRTLPWGMSIATGIIIAILSIGNYINIIDNEQYTSSSSIGESKVLDIGEFPVDVMKISDTSAISNQQHNGNGLNSTVPSLMDAQTEVGTWSKKADLPTNRIQLSISEVNGKIYVIGGSSNAGVLSTVEEYDPATDKWTKKANIPTPRYFLATSVLNGKIYAIGGEKRDAPFSIVEEYDPATDKWTRKASLSLPRTCLSACTANGKIYAIGGIASRQDWLSADVEEYDPVTDSWTKKANMPTPRHNVCTVVINDKIYAIGGLGRGWPPISTVEEYDPTSDTWTKKADIITARTYFSAVTVDEKIIVLGGTSDWPNWADAVLVDKIEEYDPVTDKWAEKGIMPTPRMYCPSSSVNGKIYVIGGLSAKNQIINLVEEYDPKGVGNGKGINFKGCLPTTWGNTKLVSNKQIFINFPTED